MAYLTVTDINPELIVEPTITTNRDWRGEITTTTSFNYDKVVENERSFAHSLPIKRLAYRGLLDDELGNPLYDRDNEDRWSRDVLRLCPVIDASQMDEARIELLRQFLPEHLKIVIRGDEMYIAEDIDVLDRYYERAFQLQSDHQKQRYDDHLKTCTGLRYAWDTGHIHCSGGGLNVDMDIVGYAGMTSGQALRKVRFSEPEEDADVQEYSPLHGTDYNYLSSYKYTDFIGLWGTISKGLELTWRFDVHHDAKVRLIYSKDDKLELRLLNHKVPSHKPVKCIIRASYNREDIGDAFEYFLRQNREISGWRSVPGDIHDPFLQRCKSAWQQSFVNKLRFNGDGSHVRSRDKLRGIKIAEHNFSRFDPDQTAHCCGDWIELGLSLGRGRPSIFNLPPNDGLKPTNRDQWERPEARAYVHHSSSIWRILFQVPYFYWAKVVRRYHMAMLIAVTLEDRDCALSVPFPVSRGLDPAFKARIENTPFMSSALQHSIYKLQYILNNWDREHCVDLELDCHNGSLGMMMPTEEFPQRMRCASAHQYYTGTRQGTVSQVLQALWNAGQSDLWDRGAKEDTVQRVARAISVEDEQLAMALEAQPEAVRNRVIRLDA